MEKYKSYSKSINFNIVNFTFPGKSLSPQYIYYLDRWKSVSLKIKIADNTFCN